MREGVVWETWALLGTYVSTILSILEILVFGLQSGKKIEEEVQINMKKR